MRTVSARTAAERCSEMQNELPERSDYLEACCDFYRFKADGIERASNLDAVLRAAARDTLHQGPESPEGANRRRTLKGCHRIVLPGTLGPVRTPAWRHFETTDFPPDYSLVRVTMPDRAIDSVRDGRNTGAADRTAGDDRSVLWTPGESGWMDPGAKRAAGESEDDGRRMGILPLVRNRARPGGLRDSEPASRVRLLYPLPGDDRAERMRQQRLPGARQQLADGSLRRTGRGLPEAGCAKHRPGGDAKSHRALRLRSARGDGTKERHRPARRHP